MSAAIPDLWPKDLGFQKVRTPAVILREQAVRLAEKTNRMVQAEVRQAPNRDLFEYDFNLCTPAAGSYRFRLFTIQYNLQMYPVQILSEVDGAPKTARDEEEFMRVVAQILASDETRRAIAVLGSQSDS